MTRLAAEGVTWGVRGEDLVRDVTLDLRPGEVLGVIGPNGAGKSSLLRLLAGLATPRAGRVTLDGTPLPAIPARDRAARIGYLPQHFAPHWDYRVRELLRLGLERGGAARGPEALAADFDLGALLDRRWSTLSGGERARALAATVLAPDPAVVLADEPAAALDIAGAAGLMRLLRARAGSGAAVALVLHDLNLAAGWCDRLLLLDAGRVATVGPPATVLADARLDRAFGVSFRRGEVAGRPFLVPDGIGAGPP